MNAIEDEIRTVRNDFSAVLDAVASSEKRGRCYLAMLELILYVLVLTCLHMQLKITKAESKRWYSQRAVLWVSRDHERSMFILHAASAAVQQGVVPSYLLVYVRPARATKQDIG